MVAYCTTADLLTGDIPLGGKYGNGSAFVQMAADEIDAAIGRVYNTPVEFDLIAHPDQRPAQLYLKKINQLLASGRIILDMAAGGEDDNLHAYGRSMLIEGLAMLQNIVDKSYLIPYADVITDEETAENTAVSIANEDPYSLVEAFYLPPGPYAYPGGFPVRPIIRPYDDPAVAG